MFITLKKRREKQKEETCQKILDEGSGSPSFVNTSPSLVTHLANNIL